MQVACPAPAHAVNAPSGPGQSGGRAAALVQLSFLNRLPAPTAPAPNRSVLSQVSEGTFLFERNAINRDEVLSGEDRCSWYTTVETASGLRFIELLPPPSIGMRCCQVGRLLFRLLEP